MASRTLADWLAWQEQLHPSEIELGLARVKTVASRMPFFSAQPKIKTIIVGGTNGKGSCVAFLEQILLTQGLRVGAYSSPHLLVYNERVRVDGVMVSDGQLCDSFERVDRARRDTAGNETSLTYFEFGTLAALDIFQRERVDVQVLEVGLGGRLDAVNIMEPDAAVVTNVALDHEAWLGNTREQIGVEKAGIFRAGIPLVVGELLPPDSLQQAARSLGNHLQVAGVDFSLAEGQGTVDFAATEAGGKRVMWHGLPKPTLPLPSAACALQVIAQLQLAGQPAVAAGLQRASLPGRFQQLVCTRGANKGKRVILDVAHNPAGALFLADRIRQHIGAAAQVPVVFSALADKDHRGLVQGLATVAARWYTAPLPVPRATPVAQLVAVIRQVDPSHPVSQFDTLGAAVEQALIEQADPDSPVLVCGSFYTVAEALRHLQ